MVHRQEGTAHPQLLPRTDAGPALARERLSTRIALAATALTLGFVLAVGGLSYLAARKQVIDNHHIALRNQASLYAQQAAASLGSITRALEAFAKNPLILGSSMDSLTGETAQPLSLEDFSRINDVPVTLVIIDFEGQPVAGNGPLVRETPAWREALETGKTYATIGSDAMGDYLFVAEPISSAPSLSPEGVLLCKVALDQLQLSLPSPNDGHLTLRLVYPEQGVDGSPAEVVSGVLHDSGGLSHTEMLSLPSELQSLWIAAEASTDRSALTASLNRLLLVYATVGIGMMLAAFVLAWAGAHRLTRPLRELAAGVRSVIESSSLEHRLTVSGVLEIEQVGRGFNQMLERLEAAYRQLHLQAEAEVERQRIERALQENEAKYRRLHESMTDAFVSVDMAGNILECNRSYQAMLGYSEEELRRLTYVDLTPEKWHAFEAGIVEKQILAQGYSEVYEKEYRRKDGSIFPVELRTFLVRDSAGQPAIMWAIVRDITERKRAQEALRASEAFLEAIIEHSPHAMWVSDARGTLVRMNQACRDLLHVTDEELVGKYNVLEDNVVEQEGVMPLVKRVFERGEKARFLLHYDSSRLQAVRLREPTQIVLDVTISPVLDGRKRVVHAIIQHLDITERKQAEAALAKTVEELRFAEQRQRELLAVTRREQGRLRALLAAMSIGILFEDNRQRVEYLNPAFLRMWAIDETFDLVGHPMREILEHSTHRFARPDHASRYVLQVLDTHEISERFEINLSDGRILTQISYPVMDSEDRLLGRLWLYEDITHERQTAQQLLYLAERDPLTGLHNRHSFQEHLEQRIATALRTADRFAVVYFDLDDFKAINDTFGHRAGDMALVRTAGEVTTQVRATEMFARLGGDEFAILSTLGVGHEPGPLPARIVNTISSIPFRFRGTNLRLTASVGIALFPEHGENVEDLVAHADSAMYQAKNQGKNSWALYDPSRDATEAIVRRLNWNSRIAQALELDLFELHFQGVYRTQDRALSHLEVLIRMRDPNAPEQPILPGQFIHLAEKSGQVLDIDRWVLTRSIALLGQHAHLPPLAVNLSGRTFGDPGLPQFIQKLLMKHGVDPRRLFVELTETAAVSDLEDAQRFIEAIQRVGCSVCLDDFGSGFSTFTYLKYLNVKVLKIDGLFVRDLPKHHDNQVFIRAMVEVARGLKKITVAEFVEDAATLDMLRNLGVDLAQGYHLDRPVAEHSVLTA